MPLALHFEGAQLAAETFTIFEDGSGRRNYRSLYPLNSRTPALTASLAAPVQISPPDGAVFNNFPRTTVLRWSAVDRADGYGVEIDCFRRRVSNRRCPEVAGGTRITDNLADPNYTFDWIGAQPGRWHVWAVDASGRKDAVSGWWTFTYTK